MVGAGGTRRSLSAAFGGPEGPRRGFRLARPGVIAYPTAGRARRPRRDLTGTGRPGSSPRLPPAAVLTLGVPPAPTTHVRRRPAPPPPPRPAHPTRPPRPQPAPGTSTSHRAPPDGHLPTDPATPPDVTGHEGENGALRAPGAAVAARAADALRGDSRALRGRMVRASGRARLRFCSLPVGCGAASPRQPGPGGVRAPPGGWGRRPVSEGGEGSPARPRTGPGSSDGARAGAGLWGPTGWRPAGCARSPRIVRASSWPRGRPAVRDSAAVSGASPARTPARR